MARKRFLRPDELPFQSLARSFLSAGLANLGLASPNGGIPPLGPDAARCRQPRRFDCLSSLLCLCCACVLAVLSILLSPLARCDGLSVRPIRASLGLAVPPARCHATNYPLPPTRPLPPTDRAAARPVIVRGRVLLASPLAGNDSRRQARIAEADRRRPREAELCAGSPVDRARCCPSRRIRAQRPPKAVRKARSVFAELAWQKAAALFFGRSCRPRCALFAERPLMVRSREKAVGIPP